MKPEEVIRAIDLIREIDINTPITQVDITNAEWCKEMAIEALEKQVPKKPRYYIDNWGHNRPGCPGCARNEILYAGQKYCSVCGTKIDWSDPKHD